MPALLLGTVLGVGIRQFLKVVTALGKVKQCDEEARELEESLGEHLVLSREEPLEGSSLCTWEGGPPREGGAGAKTVNCRQAGGFKEQ